MPTTLASSAVTAVDARRRRAKELAKNDYRLLRELVRVRISRGLTQQQVAEKLGVTQQAISKFERIDSDPRLSTIREYAHAVEALVGHIVQPDNGQLETGVWMAVNFWAGGIASNYDSYIAQARNSKRTDFAIAA